MKKQKIILVSGLSVILIMSAGIFFIEENKKNEMIKQTTESDFLDESMADENDTDVTVTDITDGRVSEKSNTEKNTESIGKHESLQKENENQEPLIGGNNQDTEKNGGETNVTEPESSEQPENDDKKKNDKTSYQYDKLGRLILEEHEEYCIYYTYDSNGNITKIENHGK
ncbi:MAG: hypothetical protein PUF12_08635 [Thermoflexaceae bacterium]|nr:hypothetical protein [Thermoflexaceae bacterium]